MPIKRLTLILALFMPIALLGPATSATYECKGDNRRSDLAAGSVTPDSVDDGQIDKFWVTVPAGTTGYLAVQMSHGDIDLRVCKKSNNKLVCESTNSQMVHDGCHVSQLSISCVVLDDCWLAEWDDGLPPGKYRVDINHCFSSKDNPNDPQAFCDYAEGDLGVVLDPGGLDDVPAIQYAVLFATA